MAPPGIPAGNPPGIPRGGIPPSQSVNFMVIDCVGMGLIPAGTWRHAQQPPANIIEIRPAVVEESAIEQHSASVTIQTPSSEVSQILNLDATGKSLIPLRRWRQAQQHPTKRIGIREAVVE